MPLDTSIPLQVQSVNPTNLISSFLDLGLKKTALDRQRETFDADVAGAKAHSSSAQSAATVAAANVNPQIAQQKAQTETAQTGAQASAYALQGAQAQRSREIASSLLQDPAVIGGNLDGILGRVSEARAMMIASGIPAHTAEMNTAALVNQAIKDPKGVSQMLKNYIVAGQQASQQSATLNPNTTFLPTAQGTQPINLNSFAPGGVGVQGAPIAPPNQISQDTTGAPAIVNPTTGSATQFQSGGAPMSFPSGETAQTQQALQGERDAAKSAALAVPQMHDINRSIVAEVDKGITTGSLGQVLNKIRGAFGNQVMEEAGTDYNVLGKFLERSALVASQSMGPHTNAGLEAQVRANGSTDYTPGAIRKIATLNDALSSGATMYQQGLERAIQSGGNVFAKRSFDQQWAQAMNPSDGVNGVQALRLKNAVDNGDQKELMTVVKEVGGKGSKGADALYRKLTMLNQLSGQ